MRRQEVRNTAIKLPQNLHFYRSRTIRGVISPPMPLTVPRDLVYTLLVIGKFR